MTNSKKQFFLLSLFGLFFTLSSLAQTAPAHLKYFGFVAIDCFYDDPLDASSITNYITEVDTFSNIAHMCVYDCTDDIVARTNLMNAHCVNPIVHIQEVFFQIVDTNAPSGANYDLRPNFAARWATFIATNAAVLNQSQIACFYVADEPAWNGISFAEMDTVCSLVKSTFPTIPILLVEAYTSVAVMQVPQTVDWVGFDRYGVFDPQFDLAFQQDLDTVKARLSSPTQKIVLVIDDQWLPYYGQAGYPPDTMKYVVQNYYDLAVADTSVIGLVGYIWPGGLDDPGHLGVRNLTQGVIDKNIEIGQLIKANYSPCSASNIETSETTAATMSVFPSPAVDQLTIEFSIRLNNATITMYNSFGTLASTIEHAAGKSMQLETAHLAAGMYYVVVQDGATQLQQKVLVVH